MEATKRKINDLIDIIIYSEEMWIDGVGNRYQLYELDTEHLINIVLYIVKNRNQIRRRTMTRFLEKSEELEMDDINSYVENQLQKDCYNWLVGTSVFRGLLVECSNRNIVASVKALIFNVMEEENEE